MFGVDLQTFYALQAFGADAISTALILYLAVRFPWTRHRAGEPHSASNCR